ncbi:MAG: ArsR family transcriptional regulator [Methanophagales archaeon ANME-1-THS]|nr:MAG: ArsR family transcriptional regulator [Methanophagales archaeon ANME-1-THS]
MAPQISYHPNAYLERRKNVRRGLQARTKILAVMDSTQPLTVKEISELAGLSYAASLHHLRLLEDERITKRKGKKPFGWKRTGRGQKSLEQLT